MLHISCNNILFYILALLQSFVIYRSFHCQKINFYLLTFFYLPCATFLWHHSTINLGMLPSLPSNNGWTSLTCRLDVFSLPPTFNKPFSSMYRSRLYMPLLLLNDFLLPVLPSLRWSISLPKTYCWCNLITSSCTYSSKGTSRLVGDSALGV